MPTMIDEVRTLHGPEVFVHDDGMNVDVRCSECTRIARDTCSQHSEEGSAEVGVPFPCPTRVAAGMTLEDGREKAREMRLSHLTVMHQDAVDLAERLETVIALVTNQGPAEADEPESEPDPKPEAKQSDEEPAEKKPAKPRRASKVTKSKAETSTAKEPEPETEAPAENEPEDAASLEVDDDDF